MATQPAAAKAKQNTVSLKHLAATLAEDHEMPKKQAEALLGDAADKLGDEGKLGADHREPVLALDGEQRREFLARHAGRQILRRRHRGEVLLGKPQISPTRAHGKPVLLPTGRKIFVTER